MDVKLTMKTESTIRLHVAEYMQIERKDVTEATITKLINQMVARAGEQCNLAEDFLE